MSLGALSPEAHRALTIGIRRSAAPRTPARAARTRPGTRRARTAGRTDSEIKQVASARFGVTAEYLARAEQLEIKMAQGSKPGEGGQLPGRKVTALHRLPAPRAAGPDADQPAAAPRHLLDRGPRPAHRRPARDQPGARGSASSSSRRAASARSRRAWPRPAPTTSTCQRPRRRDRAPRRCRRSSTSARRGSSAWPRSTRSLLRNGLRDRVALRTDGGLQTGHDLLIAALLGAEEFAFGTGALVAVGCDMARQCHLDTCPTGIATQREDLRAKFTGTPEMVVAFFLRIAEDLRRSLAAVGARSVGEVVGEGRRFLREGTGSTVDLGALLSPGVGRVRRAARGALGGVARHRPPGRHPRSRRGSSRRSAARTGDLAASGLRVTTADRSFGAALTGAIQRGDLRAPVSLALRGAAGQSFGAWAGEGVSLVLEGPANDYVGKGLSGGHLVVRPAPEMLAAVARPATARRARAPRRRRARPSAHRPRRSPSPATPASTARPAAGCTSSAGPGCGSRSGTRAPRRSSRASGPTAAST